MSGEFERIAKLRAIYGEGHQGVALGIGDDAAILAPGLVISVDAQVEGAHFRRAWIGEGATWRDVGYRASIAALSDLAAMGAKPRAMVQALVLPRDEDDAVVLGIAEGAADAARAYGAPIVGGNLARGGELSITTTVIGEMEGAAPLVRSGARPGDVVWVTGVLGASALGLLALEAGLRDADAAPFVRAFLAPTPRIREARAVLGRARAGIDVSDGLVQDLGHVAAASDVAIEIDEHALPLAPGSCELARRLGHDAIELALTGGEDFELVVIAPEGVTIDEATRIGRVRSGRGVHVLDRDGRVRTLARTGFDHFG